VSGYSHAERADDGFGEVTGGGRAARGGQRRTEPDNGSAGPAPNGTVVDGSGIEDLL
jgi:hypothetical protein